MLSEAADNSALEACPDSVQFPGSIRWGAAHFFEPIISLRPCLRGELRSMPRTTCPSGVAYHPGPRTRRTITSPGSRDGSWLPPDHAAGAKLRCLRLLRAIRCAISPQISAASGVAYSRKGRPITLLNWTEVGPKWMTNGQELSCVQIEGPIRTE